MTMPNLNPVPDSIETLNKQLELIKKDSVIRGDWFGADQQVFRRLSGQALLRGPTAHRQG